MKFIGIDIGGTWIKGAQVDEDFFNLQQSQRKINFPVRKVKSPLSQNGRSDELSIVLAELVNKITGNEKKIAAIGISTAGIVNYSGTQVVKAADHLSLLRNDEWKIALEQQFNCRVVLVNDADAAAIGLSELGYLSGNKAIGIMPVGTGLGFSVWRNGRRWQPGKSYTLLGSINTPEGNFDSMASVSKLAGFEKNNDLIKVFTHPSFLKERNNYIRNLSKIIKSASILYTLDEVVICGGLANAVSDSGFPLEEHLNKNLKEQSGSLNHPIKISIVKEGNQLPLFGAMALAFGESIAFEKRNIPKYRTLDTEIPYDKKLHLDKMDTKEILESLWQAEQEAGSRLKGSLEVVGLIVDESVKRIKNGGRIIYVGSGTSGRIAAMDAVEIPCTYGFPEDRIIALIAGGISDASIEIESDFEEDASAVPEMLLTNINANDVVIGISASGAAYFVQSALAFAKNRGARTALVKVNSSEDKLPYCDYVIPLNSGNEVVAGSTRMKAGTATKKVLNFLSSTIMIKLGKVKGSYMVDVACINNKLVERALAILKILYGLEKEEAMERLSQADMNLNRAIEKCRLPYV